MTLKRKNTGMRPEYDFTDRKGVRGKFAKALEEGYTERIYKGRKLLVERIKLYNNLHPVRDDQG